MCPSPDREAILHWARTRPSRYEVTSFALESTHAACTSMIGLSRSGGRRRHDSTHRPPRLPAHPDHRQPDRGNQQPHDRRGRRCPTFTEEGATPSIFACKRLHRGPIRLIWRRSMPFKRGCLAKSAEMIVPERRNGCGRSQFLSAISSADAPLPRAVTAWTYVRRAIP
jgi:hypothetical protein